MAKELFVSSTPHETKVAIVEDDQLAEIYYERENEYTLAGSIYKGRVTRVLPGMQSAFVNIGLERDAFLYVSDFLLEEDEDADAIGEAVSRSRSESPVIEIRGPESDQEPIEAEQILPPAATAEEPATSEESPAESAAEDEGNRQEPEREGARRWRGRRRRGRGGRDRFADRGAGERTGGERTEAEQAEASPAEDRGEAQPESQSEPRSESYPEPRAERPRAEHQRPEPVLLPGESISKYQPQGQQSYASAPAAVKTESAPRPRPSTEY